MAFQSDVQNSPAFRIAPFPFYCQTNNFLFWQGCRSAKSECKTGFGKKHAREEILTSDWLVALVKKPFSVVRE